MSTREERDRIAESIVNFEARRDAHGRLKVYQLPSGDGGGAYEVAGINERYHPQEAKRLAELVNAGKFDEAEHMARDFILTFTDGVATWTTVTALESYLRDSAFNRGPGGAARILQRALGLKDDGGVGPITRSALAQAENDPRALLDKLRTAREQYERDVVGRDETSKFWRGLVNRWNKALEVAQTFLAASAPSASPSPSFSAAEAAVKNALAGGSPSLPPPPAGAMASSPPPAWTGGEPVAIPALRIGMQSALVLAWQSFLLGQGYDPGGLDGRFGDKTLAATRAFQQQHNVAPDGVAGRQTLLCAMQLGFELIEEPAPDASGSNFPPQPDFPPLVDNAARQAVFGKFDYVSEPQPRNREHIRILGSWEADNIVTVPIPQMKRAMGPGAPSGMQFHRLGARQLAGLWADWEAANLLSRILAFDGAFVPRFVRGSTRTLSNHAFGSAFDINAEFNPRGARPALVGERGSVRELVPIAHRWGFYWGGHFASKPDGMHFEVAHLL